MKRMNFEAIGADSTIYRRSSTSRLYSHCVVIHFDGQGPNKIFPEGVKPYSRTEWSLRRGLAERNAARWRTHQRVASIEILEAMQV